MRPGHGLILICISLLSIGVVMVTSAGLTVSGSEQITLQSVLLGKTALLAMASMVALFVGSYFPVDALYASRTARSFIPWLLLVMAGLLLAVHVPHIGREVNGAKRWLEIGPVGFQPSEIAKWGMIIVLAWYLARNASVMQSLLKGFVPPMILVLFICMLIASEDLGTATLICLVSVGMLVAGGSKLWHALLLMPIGVAGFVGAVIVSPYRIDRLKAFLDPYADPQGIGYHVLQSMGAISSGGLAGRGLGNSIHKFGYLPEDTTDFIFAIICEELGIVGAVLVVALYAAFIICGLAIIRRTTQPFHRLLAIGVILTIGLQALINIAVVTGSAPTKGIALPLLSSGGTGWLVTAFCIGLLVSIDRKSEHRIMRAAQDSQCDEGRIDTPNLASNASIMLDAGI
ncbi:MAG TPA: putative peptidoglycan glycosyltransferase FtsW [Phycisphaerales bacterium]|nr:putative peptidoglycan glycosyltransferase FtsW [Phycisphaerales bacterium]